MQTQNTYYRDKAPATDLLGQVDAASRKEGAPAGADLQATFLRLLIAQMQNQDPTNPMDSSQMTSQLAQINTVTGIGQLNTQLSALAAQLGANQQMEMSMLIGATVLAPGNTTAVVEGKSTGFGVQLDHDVDNLDIVVKDSAGRVVDTLHLGKQSAGTIPLGWEPKGPNGEDLPDGTYTFTATSTTRSGNSETHKTLAASVVQGVVKQPDGSFRLALSNGVFAQLGDISAIV
jgi:flagellar basal-body rod modification protein FlgD